MKIRYYLGVDRPAEAPAARSLWPDSLMAPDHMPLRTLLEAVERRALSMHEADQLVNLVAQLAAAPAAPAEGGEDAPFGHYFRDMEGRQHFHTGSTVPPFAHSEITPLYLYTAPRVTGGREDSARLDFLVRQSMDLRCFDSGDDIGWRVIEHHMAEPRERVVAEVFKDDPRAAIDAALQAANGGEG